MYAVHQLQDRLRLYTGGEEAQSAKRVRMQLRLLTRGEPLLILLHSAKYIEGLENRLGRMEHLLRLSGTFWSYYDGGTCGEGAVRIANIAM